LQRYPDKFYVFAGVDPRWGVDGIQLFEKAVYGYGFHGLKLYPPCGYSPSDPALYPYYEICAHRGLPVLTHTGATSPALGFETARPIFVDQAALDFPGVNFILAHGSINYVEECTMLCAFRPNIYLDISGFEMTPVEHLNPLLYRGINHKIIFGTDWPVFRMQGSQKSFVEKLLDEDGPMGNLRKNELESIFHKSIQSLLNRQTKTKAN
jgi:predicted TIM-barrel fold metal-dependent hydrolase